MTSDSGDGRMAPDEAFSVLGDETRIEILRELGESDERLAFSTLYDRTSVDDTGQFNYHLNRLVGHFVRKESEGYVLSEPGRRVVEAVLSGAVTEVPEQTKQRVDVECEHCGALTEIRWRAGSVERFCTNCAGNYERAYSDTDDGQIVDDGYLGRYPFPPSGLDGRTPDEILRSAWTWGNLEILALSAGICPRCSATVAYERYVCTDHDETDSRCAKCDRRQAVALSAECTNCIFEAGGAAVIGLVADPHLLQFLVDHGVNPVSPECVSRIASVHGDYDEEILSTDPFEAKFSFALDDEILTLWVDESLEVYKKARKNAP